MNVLIVEDEPLAREQLQQMLARIAPEASVMATFDRADHTAQWLQQHQPDLIFLDIHLADALSFTIFEQVEVDSPVIFTTAYDHYALKAFEVHSVAYLLKPYDEEDLQAALEKYERYHRPQPDAVAAIQQALTQTQPKTYQQRFLVRKGEKVASIKVEDIAYFEGEDRYVSLVRLDGRRYFVDYKLSDLVDMLDPEQFFRLNRSYICHFDAIDEIFTVSKSRLQVSLQPPTKRSIVVSTDNTRLFKAWLNR
jgi:DNA-binding LytR/AlgR family response regulator